jgi:hypothetical protein
MVEYVNDQGNNHDQSDFSRGSEEAHPNDRYCAKGMNPLYVFIACCRYEMSVMKDGKVVENEKRMSSGQPPGREMSKHRMYSTVIIRRSMLRNDCAWHRPQTGNRHAPVRQMHQPQVK